MLGGVLVGARQQETPVGDVGEGRPDLCAVHEKVVAVVFGDGLDAGEVGAGVGLAEKLAPAHVGLGDGRQEALFLGLRAVADEQGADHARADAVAARGLVLDDLLGVDDLPEVRPLLPAVLLGPGHDEPALVGELAVELPLEVVGVSAAVLVVADVADAPVGGQRLPQEVADLGAERLFFFGEGEVHDGRGGVGRGRRTRLRKDGGILGGRLRACQRGGRKVDDHRPASAAESLPPLQLASSTVSKSCSAESKASASSVVQFPIKWSSEEPTVSVPLRPPPRRPAPFRSSRSAA